MVPDARVHQCSALPQSFRRRRRPPERLEGSERSREVPFTTKADLRENYPFKMFAVPQDKVSRIHASSGTTGRPTVVGYTSNDLNNWADLIARSLGRRRAVFGQSSRGLRVRPVHRWVGSTLRC